MDQDFEVISFNGGHEVLGTTIEEIKGIVAAVSPPTHKGIMESFERAGWSTEVNLLGSYRCDVYKDGVAIEVESVDKSSVIDVLHRDFFRFLILLRMGRIRVAVLITSITGGEVSLRKAESDLRLYGDHYEVPLVLIGVTPVV